MMGMILCRWVVWEQANSRGDYYLSSTTLKDVVTLLQRLLVNSAHINLATSELGSNWGAMFTRNVPN